MLTAAPRGAGRECRPGQRNGPPTEQRNFERRNGDDAYENSLTPRAPYKVGVMICVPFPGLLSIVMPPPLCSTKPFTIDRPRPVPWPTGLVVKNGSKTLASMVWSMPTLESETDRQRYRPGRTSAGWDTPSLTVSAAAD